MMTNMTTNHFRTNHRTAGFTLVELLVVIAILGTISGMFVMAYRGAQQESNTQKTRLTVQKISDVLMARLQEYENYPVPTGIPGTATASAAGPKQLLEDRARLLLLRDIIRTEMPDHPDDLRGHNGVIIFSNPTGLHYSNGNPIRVPTVQPPALGLTSDQLTSRAKVMYDKLQLVPQWDLVNANAELLYLIVEDSQLDGSSAIEAFGASEIADTDGDGLYEFIDAFGRPIRWIRWPSGYPQVGRSYPDMLDKNIIDNLTDPPSLKIDSDPFDYLKSDPGWRSSNPASRPSVYPYPLVVSAGLDGFFGLNFREGVLNTPFQFPYPEQYDAPHAGLVRFSDPWAPRTSPELRMGSLQIDPTAPPTASAEIVASDNLTNYEGAASSL